ncbi:MAG: TIGR04222 domain-containing membrane protein [Burkholderiales bacterium]
MKFFPFNLSGPQFLLFYCELIVFVFVLLAIAFRVRQMAGVSEDPRLTDPYEIALLRAGPAEAVRIVMMSLVDRDLLRLDGILFVARADALELVRRPLERAVISHFRHPKSDPPETVADGLLASPSLDTTRRDLVQRQLLSDPWDFWANPCFAPAIAALSALGLVALIRALASGPPLFFLVALFLLASFVVLKSYTRRSTPLGRRTLRQLQTLFKRLQGRASTLRSGGQTNEATLLAAVFGINALPASQFKWLDRLRTPKDSRSSSCGSSCSSSSSSSCGGGGGGGGCGGGCGGGGD